MSGRNSAEIDPRVGTVLGGKYRIVRRLGAGGMGAVYEAINTWTERRVALKVMLSELSADAHLVGRFLQEARAAAKVHHRHIVEVFDMGQDPTDGSLFIVQEFLTGNELRTLLDQRKRLSLREAYELLLPIMQALHAAHRAGVVHRDLKPENIFLVQEEHGGTFPKLIDFGIAKVADSDGPKGLTRTGAAMGTPHYMSPEQARGAKNIDAQTDVWAMGVLWFECLSGTYPYDGDGYNELLAKILTEDPTRLSQVAPELPAGVANAVMGALQRDRAQRHATMSAFTTALLAATELANEPWMQPLREMHRTLDGSSSGALPIVSVSSDVLGQAKTEFSGAHPRANTTFSGAATSMHTKASASKMLRLGFGLGILLLAALGAVGIRMRSLPEQHTGAPVVAASVQTSPRSYVAQVTVVPASATMTLDGETIVGNVLAREFSRDGRMHTLRVSADGFEGQTVTFRDAPPPERISLEPALVMNAPTIAAPIPSAAPRVANRAPTPRATASAAPSNPPSVPRNPRPATNGAPVLDN